MIMEYLNDKFHINEMTVSKNGLFFISPEKADIIAESWMFLPELLSC